MRPTALTGEWGGEYAPDDWADAVREVGQAPKPGVHIEILQEMLEPMGVHRDHRGHGYGTAITVAAAATLRELGSSSAIVCTASSNVGAVATYGSAGFRQLPDVKDLRRTA